MGKSHKHDDTLVNVEFTITRDYRVEITVGELHSLMEDANSPYVRPALSSLDDPNDAADYAFALLTNNRHAADEILPSLGENEGFDSETIEVTQVDC